MTDKNKILLLIIVFVFLQCKNNYHSEAANEILKLKSIYNNENAFSHFPRDLRKCKSFYSYHSKDNSFGELFVVKDLYTSTLDSFKKLQYIHKGKYDSLSYVKLTSNMRNNFSPIDSTYNFFIADITQIDFNEGEKCDSVFVYQGKEHLSCHYIIPDDLEILIIDYSFGPSLKKGGHSRGIAFSEKQSTILYWLVFLGNAPNRELLQ